MVDDPVIAKTVQIKATSRYQAMVHRSGIGLGPRNRFQTDNVEISAADVDFDVVETDDVAAAFVPALSVDRKRTTPLRWWQQRSCG